MAIQFAALIPALLGALKGAAVAGGAGLGKAAIAGGGKLLAGGKALAAGGGKLLSSQAARNAAGSLLGRKPDIFTSAGAGFRKNLAGKYFSKTPFLGRSLGFGKKAALNLFKGYGLEGLLGGGGEASASGGGTTVGGSSDYGYGNLYQPPTLNLPSLSAPSIGELLSQVIARRRGLYGGL